MIIQTKSGKTAVLKKRHGDILKNYIYADDGTFTIFSTCPNRDGVGGWKVNRLVGRNDLKGKERRVKEEVYKVVGGRCSRSFLCSSTVLHSCCFSSWASRSRVSTWTLVLLHHFLWLFGGGHVFVSAGSPPSACSLRVLSFRELISLTAEFKSSQYSITFLQQRATCCQTWSHLHLLY